MHLMPHPLQTPESFLPLFGKQDFRPLQRNIIQTILDGRSCLGVLPTGSGKSLCYQLPAVMLNALTVVVSPLIALMRDQVDGLVRLGIAAARYDSSLTDEEKTEVLHAISSATLSMVFVAPESLERQELQRAMEGVPLGLFVVDEAHCLSEWGHSFRPDYLGLPSYAKTRPFHAVLALTATATVRVREDLIRLFDIRANDAFCLPPSKENIRRSVRFVDEEVRNDALLEFLQSPGNTPGIIYVRTRKDTDNLAAWLQNRQIKARSYHAGMPTEARACIQDSFLAGKTDVLVATIAFGMGVDKQDVRSVVHFHPPTSPEAYVQESGRAGRDGQPAQSLIFISPGDTIAAGNRIRASLPDERSLEVALSRLLIRGRHVVSYYAATTESDLPETVFNRLLFDLKREGALKETGSGYQYYKVKPLFPLETILSGRNHEETERLHWLDAHREGEVEDAAIAFGISFAEACAWLADLDATGEWKTTFRQIAIELEPSPDALPPTVWRDRYVRLMYERMQHEQERFNIIMRFLTDGSCLSANLDYYFGFPSSPCGHCSACRNDQMKIPETRPATAMTDEERLALAELVARNYPSLARAEQLTRFLIGQPGPAAMRARLWSHPLYGALAHLPWDDVWTEAYAILGR